jgi:hypothetical protein
MVIAYRDNDIDMSGVFCAFFRAPLEEEELDEFFNYYRHRNLALLYVIKKYL